MSETDENPLPDEELRAFVRSAGVSSAASGDPAGDSSALAALRERVQAGVAAEERRPLAGLRQRPTWQRALVGVAALGTLVMTTWVAIPRTDLASYPAWRLALELCAYGAAFVLCALVALRGAHLPALPPWKTYGLSGAAVALVALVGLLPAPHAHDEHVSRGVAELLSPCGLVGALVALPVYLLVRLLDRGSSLSAVAAGTAAGLAGNTFLQMHCANTGTAHMALGHAMVVVWCVLGVLLARRLERA
ncbi:MAG: NrsF family protein [Polyangiales bacterium]